MMIGEAPRLNPTVQIPAWDPLDDPTATVGSPFAALGSTGNAASPGGGDFPQSPSPFLDSLTSLHRYLPSNEIDSLSFDDESVDSFSCDEFRMYEFKVRRCTRGRSHDWTECPFAHPGEKARRRDPRKYHYSGTACPDFRKGGCAKGDSCEFAHGVFECWLHPARYRTQPCKDGTSCRRRVCFFAHTPDQLRVLPQQSPRRAESEYSLSGRHLFDQILAKSGSGSFISSPTSILDSPPSESPPMSPSYGKLGVDSFNPASELLSSMRKLQLGKVERGGCGGGWGLQVGSGFGSPRSPVPRPGFCSLPGTPARAGRLGKFDIWDSAGCSEEEPAMERVESGKELRARMYAKLSKENSLDRVNPPGAAGGPDVGWVHELVK